MERRTFLKTCATAAASSVVLSQLRSRAQDQVTQAKASGRPIILDPTPLFDFSPLFYMQFMEPLGATDAAVEAAWSYDSDRWRRDFVEVTKDLAPDVIRFGGLLSRYYKWREGVGPAAQRPLYRNYVWGGKETHRLGTHEFADFCTQVRAEPLYCVNFRGDGFQIYASTPEGDRTGDAQEAADWVSYANDPDHASRKAHGRAEPYGIKLWQLGNETSYGRGGFTKDQSIAATIEFAQAMRARDPKLQLIGWGDDRWAGDLAERAGEHIDFVAAHMMGQTPIAKDTVLNGNLYQDQPERAWEELREMIPVRIEKKLLALEAELDQRRSKLPIAITEGHLSLAPHNANPILTEWLTGVYHARAMNLYHRHGGRVRMCTGADFNGMRWTVSAVMHQVPRGVSYLLPIGSVMRLFKRHNGKQGIRVQSAPDGLDIAASRTDEKMFLHVANMNFSGAVDATFAVDKMVVRGGKVFEIAPERIRQAVSYQNPEVFKPVERVLAAGDKPAWRFPARSVSVVELDCAG